MALILRWLLWAYPEVDYGANEGKPWLCFRRVHLGRSDGDLYLQRFIILRTPLGSIYLHRFLRGDEDKCLHDHPFGFVSIILKGGYWEETPGGKVWIRPGSARYCPAAWRHRVILNPNRTGSTWTIIFTTRKVRSWGFWTNKGTVWVPWREFADGGSQGCE